LQDFRAGRRWLAEEVHRRKEMDRVSVLNTFANTCTAGVVAAAAGARLVCNVDVSASCLTDGQRNAALNGVEMETLRYDAIPAMRMFAGMPIAQDRRRRPASAPRRGEDPKPAPAQKKLKPRRFSIVVLDPPTFAKGSGGVVDIIRDYNSLLKPALMSLEEGGVVLATHHAARIGMEEWRANCVRCAEKCGRPLAAEPEVVAPDADYPVRTGTEGHLLKMLVLRV
jgi:23S rRNA (cytosine1962-C5)-methyltransferase